MKRLGMLLVLLSVSMFALGCKPAEEKQPTGKTLTTVEESEGGAPAGEAPAGETTDEEKPADETPAP